MSAIGQWREGKYLEAVKEVLHAVVTAFKSIESDIPALGTFVNQFKSDFGVAALHDGQAFVAAIKSGETNILDAAKELVLQLKDDALDTAGHDALTVATNALGVLVRAPEAAKTTEDPAA